MNDPVQAPDGKTYERSAITEWLNRNGRSPETRQIMPVSQLKENYAIKHLIDVYNNGSTTTSSPTIMIDDTFEKQDPKIDFKVECTYSTFETPKLIFKIFETLDPELYKIFTDLVIIFDRSGSMSQGVGAQNASGVTVEDGFSAQDIVGHSTKTTINTLSENDTFTVIAFDNRIEVLETTFHKANESNKKSICDRISSIKPRGQTAIWNAIKKGTELIRMRIDKTRNPAIMILTDGAPNISPAQGEVKALQKERKENIHNIPIYTFGFGNALQKNLLYEIAKYSDACFGHIPTADMIATIFNNYIATILCTLCYNMKLIILFENEQHMADIINIANPVMGDFVYTIKDNTLIINIGTMQIQQSKSVIINFREITSPDDIHNIKYKLTYINKNQNIDMESMPIKLSHNFNIYNEYFRFLVVDGLKAAILSRQLNGDPTNDMQAIISKIEENQELDTEIKLNMLDTLKDQISKAISMRSDEINYFNKWGMLYLEQLIRAINQQIKPNFKDKICFNFGGEYFNELVDKSSDIFDNMEPPTPSNQSTSHMANTTAQVYRGLGSSYQTSCSTYTPDMSNYNNLKGGCFGENCQVKLATGDYISIKNLEVGTFINTFDVNNNYIATTTKVKYIVKIYYDNDVNIIRFTNSGLEITNWHPIYNESLKTWVFPFQLTDQTMESVNVKYVYNVVLENYHVIELNLTKCITLGHNYKFDNLQHPYFGSNKIIEDLEKFTEFNKSGYIEINSNSIQKDTHTNLICKM